MNLIEIVILIFTVQISSFLMLLTGMHIKSKNNKKINLNPVEIIKEKKTEKENRDKNELEHKQMKVMLENINNYDGTPIGQKDIPTEN